MSGELPALSGRRLLVVDANVDRSESVADMLADLGAAASIASGLHHALDVLEAAEAAFDAVVLADRLPDGDGTVLARAIRTSPVLFELHLVILSGGPTPEDVDASCAWPVTPASLAAAILGQRARSVHAAAVEAPVLDLAELESIAGGMTPELMMMLRRFTAQADVLAAEAMAAVESRDSEAAQSRAHALKGAALSAGATRLGRAARAFEAAVARADWGTAASIDLRAESRTLAAVIDALPDPTA